MKTVNKRVACSLFPETSVRTEVSRGVMLIKQRAQLTKLDVIYDYSDADVAYYAGDEVWVRGDTMRAAPEVFEVEGQPFVLVPRESIVMVRRKPIEPRVFLGGPVGQSCPCPPESSFLDK